MPTDESSVQRNAAPSVPSPPAAARIRSELFRVGKSISVVTVAIGGIVGAMSAILTAVFLIRPNLSPSSGNRATITDVVVEPDVTLQEYFSHFSVKSALQRLETKYPERTQTLLTNDRPLLNTVGTVVHFDFEVFGLRGILIGGRWSLFDGDTGRRLGESEDLDPLPLSFKFEKKDSDVGSWESWINTSSFRTQHFFVRLELFDERDDTRIMFKDSQAFKGATTR